MYQWITRVSSIVSLTSLQLLYTLF